MEAQLKKYSETDRLSGKVESLERLVDVWQQNVNFNLVMTWTILGIVLGFVIAAAGWALTVLAKKWVQEAADKKFIEIEESIKSKVTKEIEKKFSTHILLIIAGTTVLIPYKSPEGHMPAISIRDHDENRKATIKVGRENIEISNRYTDDILLDLIIFDAEVTL